MTFSSLGLTASLLKSLAELGYSEPYPIQQEAIPAILEGKDLLGIAPTGSGKTAAYALPLLRNLEGLSAAKSRHIKVLVLVPTRELAMQVSAGFRQFSRYHPMAGKTMAVYGGISINPQMKAMYGIEILVATPGRLLELVDEKAVHLSKVEALVLDEADKMLNLGFQDEMQKIITLLPGKRQNLLFSATLNEDVNNITQLLLHDPFVIKIEAESENLDLITQLGYFVTEERKGPLLRYIIKHNDLKQVLVFTSSVYSADNLVDKLKRNGIEALSMHSRKSQGARIEALNRFKTGKLRVLVATDLVSRGIDIKELPHVINYELPRSPKDYIHRIGRTGRAETPGEAISLITPADKDHFRVIQKKMGKWVTMIESDGINLAGY
jgi:ATP-dependent RNA helicase RhlE